MTLLQLLRIHQWLKNLMLLFPPFLSGSLGNTGSFFTLVIPLLSFCLASSSIYIINDLLDLKQDIHHPVKKRRPLPSGKIKIRSAAILACLLCFLSIWSAYHVSMNFLLVVTAYLIVSNSYSLFLKSVPLLEIFCIVAGFIFRLEAGGIAYHVPISEWLFLSVFLLALFLVSGKRLSEIMHSDGQPPEMIRPVLARYPKHFFQASINISGAAVLVTYTMYVISHHSNILLIPLCCLGLLQYILRVLSGRGGDPTRALLKDPLLFAIGLAWAVMVGFDIYR